MCVVRLPRSIWQIWADTTIVKFLVPLWTSSHLIVVVSVGHLNFITLLGHWAHRSTQQSFPQFLHVKWEGTYLVAGGIEFPHLTLDLWKKRQCNRKKQVECHKMSFLKPKWYHSADGMEGRIVLKSWRIQKWWTLLYLYVIYQEGIAKSKSIVVYNITS